MSAAIWGIMILVGFITASILDLFVAMIRGPEKAETETDKAGARTAGRTPWKMKVNMAPKPTHRPTSSNICQKQNFLLREGEGDWIP